MIEIHVSKNVSIDNIKELYWHITSAIDSETDIIINFSNVRKADISLRLIIETAVRRARNRKVKINLINIPDSLHYLFNKSVCSLEREYGKNPDC